MLLLVAALGAVVVRFSRTYLHGDPGLGRYLRWLLLTLSAVTALVVTNNLLVMALAWTASSLALHQLLTFYADRPAALVAAHKKFLVSRLADCCLAVSLSLVHVHVGSFELDRIAAWLSIRPELPFSMEVAAVFLVIAVALRSAQLPFHGWITQVMEAPTPVSALLHAGVVNIGGFVLIRLAPWVAQAEPAQLLLIAIGLASTIVAALIMTTRVSVKVALAWSTCAQMGFMLVQCGLGLWPLALLHLVAHSLYKAHAFLSAGSAVDDWTVKALTARRPPASPLLLGTAAFAAAGLALLGVIVLPPTIGVSPSYGPSDLVSTLILGLALVPLLTAGAAGGARGGIAMAPRVVGVVILYLGWHALAEHLIPAHEGASSAVGWWLTGIGFIGLFVAKAALQLRPRSRFARSLHPWLFSGLYLDELFTRITFRVWPPRLPRRMESAPRAIQSPTPLEAQA
jgi:NAD(P)H-quinone oxidoreductase subunit 5